VVAVTAAVAVVVAGAAAVADAVALKGVVGTDQNSGFG
jgi:hypothetical protein